jgi:hypothetical protein
VRPGMGQNVTVPGTVSGLLPDELDPELPETAGLENL